MMPFAGKMTHDFFPFFSALEMRDIAFESGSFRVMRVHPYFLNPILVAISRKQCLQSSRPYFPIWPPTRRQRRQRRSARPTVRFFGALCLMYFFIFDGFCLSCLNRSEEHTSELQSQFHLVCRLLL